MTIPKRFHKKVKQQSKGCGKSPPNDPIKRSQPDKALSFVDVAARISYMPKTPVWQRKENIGKTARAKGIQKKKMA